jgi:glycosyltransferase involved in cell wall biosynthesis
VAPELDRKKQHVIYNSLNPEKLTADDRFVFCSGEKRNIVVASSHQYLKNLDGLIEGVKLLTEEERKQLIVNWYGHNKFSSYDHSLEEGEKKIRDYGLEDVFRFHDATLDIYRHMNSADAVGLFSKFEGFPNAICEGMYLGKPIIATSVSDIPLLLKEGENAFLAEAEQAESIAAALRRFISASPQQLQEMGRTNRAKACELFDREKILDQYEQLFKAT